MKNILLPLVVFLISMNAFAQEANFQQQKKLAFVKAMSAVIVKYNASEDSTVTTSTMLRLTLKPLFGGRFVYALADAIALTPQYISSAQCELTTDPWAWALSTNDYIHLFDPRAIEDIRGLISDAITCQ